MAIVAVLAAILFPVLAQARQRARGASCVSNLAQIGLGVHMYCEDYDGRMPFIRILFPTAIGAPEGPVTDPHSPLVVLGPYTRNDQIFICPSRTWGVPAVGPYRLTYAFYGCDHCEKVYGWPEGQTPYTKYTQDMFETCNGQAMDAATSHRSAANGDVTQKDLARDSVRVTADGTIWPHAMGLNYLYLDGHVKLNVPSHADAYVTYGF